MHLFECIFQAVEFKILFVFDRLQRGNNAEKFSNLKVRTTWIRTHTHSHLVFKPLRLLLVSLVRYVSVCLAEDNKSRDI